MPSVSATAEGSITSSAPAVEAAVTSPARVVEPASTPAAIAAEAAATSPAPAVELAPPPPGAWNAPASVPSTELADELARADAWMAFEAGRDRHTRLAERTALPLLLTIQAALGVSYAALAGDVTTTSRVLGGVAAGLAAGALIPTVATHSRSHRRLWFASGASAFSLAAGAAIMTAPRDGEDTHVARWAGASLAVQGLLMLPVGFIAGFPEEEEYAAYERLPAAERPAAAARLLARIDRFEQRVTAIGLWGALGSAIALAAGALTADDRDQARTLGGLTLIPLVSGALTFAPRLFVRSRLDRYAHADPPRKLPFNGW